MLKNMIAVALLLVCNGCAEVVKHVASSVITTKAIDVYKEQTK